MSQLTCVKAGVTYKFDDLSETHTKDYLLRTFEKNWENNTFLTFLHVATRYDKKIAIDIGAYIGLTAIWLCKRFAHTICVEADKKSIESLEKNLKSSGCSNYTLINKPIYSKREKMYFGANNFISHAVQNDSTSQIKSVKSKDDDYEVESIIFADVITGVDPHKIGFIKVDIEGAEESIFEHLFIFAKTFKIPLFVSFHMPWWKNKDVSRFNHLFASARIFQDSLIPEKNPADYLAKNVWGSLLFEFE
jgi:FkbM family methyltransferase